MILKDIFFGSYGFQYCSREAYMKNLTQVAAGHTCKVAWIIGSFENIIRSFNLAEEQTLYILQNAGSSLLLYAGARRLAMSGDIARQIKVYEIE